MNIEPKPINKDTPLYSAALFMTTAPSWKQMIIPLGWWIILCPPLGWLMALGYRKHAVFHMMHAKELRFQPPIPTMWGCLAYLKDGLCALLVMMVVFTPALSIAFSLGSDTLPWSSTESIFRFAQYMAMTYSLPPVMLGGTLAYHQWFAPWFHLSNIELVCIGLMFVFNTYVIPLAFMQVALRGKWVDTIRIDRIIALGFKYPAAFALAWRDSLWISFAALGLIFRAPWGIAWSYLSIVWLFNRLHSHTFSNSVIEHEVDVPQDMQIKKLLGVPIPIWWKS